MSGQRKSEIPEDIVQRLEEEGTPYVLIYGGPTSTLVKHFQPEDAFNLKSNMIPQMVAQQLNAALKALTART